MRCRGDIVKQPWLSRATHCGGYLVTLPWFPASVSQSLSVSRLILVNAIVTKLLCTSSSNLANMFTMTRGLTLFILEVRSQRSRSQLTYMEISLWTRLRLNCCAHLHQTWQTCSLWREDEPYWFWRSKVKVTIDIYENKLVSTIQTKPLCASSSNLADMLAIVRGWTLLILEVKGQGHNRHLW